MGNFYIYADFFYVFKLYKYIQVLYWRFVPNKWRNTRFFSLRNDRNWWRMIEHTEQERPNNTKVNAIIIYDCTFLSSRVSFRRLKMPGFFYMVSISTNSCIVLWLKVPSIRFFFFLFHFSFSPNLNCYKRNINISNKQLNKIRRENILYI